MHRGSLRNAHFGQDLLQCSHLFFRHFNRDPRQKRLSCTQGRPCARTWNGSAVSGTTPRPPGTETRFIGPGRRVWLGDRARRALRLQRLDISDREDSFAAVIRCTADRAKAENRTRSKWSRVMRYAAAYKPSSESLAEFIQRKGGINACAARFSRCQGRSQAMRSMEKTSAKNSCARQRGAAI
jgi:hypothetical protein